MLQSWRSSPQIWLSHCVRDHFTQQDFYSSECKFNDSHSHLSQTTVSYTLHGADYENQSPWEIIYFTMLVIHEGWGEWMKFYHFAPIIYLSKIHSYSSATILHITGVKIVLEEYPNLQWVDFQIGSVVGKHWQTEDMSLFPLSQLKQGLCHCLLLILSASTGWDHLGSSSSNTAFDSPA